MTFVALVSDAAMICASNLAKRSAFLCTAVGLQTARRISLESGPGFDACPTGVAKYMANKLNETQRVNGETNGASTW